LRHSKCTYSLSWKENNKQNVLRNYCALTSYPVSKKMPLETPSALTAYPEWKTNKKMCLDTLRVLLQPIPFVKKPNCLEKLQCTDSLLRFKWHFRKLFPKHEVTSLWVSFHWLFLVLGDFTTVPPHSNYVLMNPPLVGLLSLKRGESDLGALSSSFVYNLWKGVSKISLQMG